MTLFEALPVDITEALYHYCKDDECLNDATLRALRTELKLGKAEHNKYSHDCYRCDAIKSKNNTIAQMQEQMEQMTYSANMQNETIIKLTLQLEKMKCCENCKYKGCDKANSYETCWYCKNKDKWSMRND